MAIRIRKIKFCCLEFKNAYYQYQILRKTDNWLAGLDDLEWDELKPIFMLIESFIERKCMFCKEKPVVPDYVLKKIRERSEMNNGSI